MPTKERYKKMTKGNKCPRCSKLRDNRDFVECSSCRKRGRKQNEYKEIRTEAMSLFGIKREKNNG